MSFGKSGQRRERKKSIDTAENPLLELAIMRKSREASIGTSVDLVEPEIPLKPKEFLPEVKSELFADARRVLMMSENSVLDYLEEQSNGNNQGLMLIDHIPENLDVETLKMTSRGTEVAISYDLDEFVIRTDKGYSEGRLKLSASLEEMRRLGMIELIDGELPDWVDLTAIHLKTTGRHLVDTFRDSYYVRTQTQSPDGRGLVVGKMNSKNGLFIGYSTGLREIKVPLIVPGSGRV